MSATMPHDALRATETPAKCRRHTWSLWPEDGTVPIPYRCVRCHVLYDPIKSRRGKQSVRLGKDQERRAEKRYGWEKIGERGEKTDLRGRFAKVQQKSSRRAPPALLRSVFAGLDATKDGRVPLLLLSYVRQGVPTEDFVVMRGEDWLALHGVDDPEAA